MKNICKIIAPNISIFNTKLYFKHNPIYIENIYNIINDEKSLYNILSINNKELFATAKHKFLNLYTNDQTKNNTYHAKSIILAHKFDYDFYIIENKKKIYKKKDTYILYNTDIKQFNYLEEEYFLEYFSRYNNFNTIPLISSIEQQKKWALENHCIEHLADIEKLN